MVATPNFSNNQFVDAPMLNTAFGTVSGAIAGAAQASLAVAGLLYPEAVPAFTTSGLVVSGSFPAPFALVTSGGVIAYAHGTVTNADTQSYVMDFTSLVPASGSVLAYVTVAASAVAQNPIGVPGPPVGFPTYNPNFVPTIGYQSTTDTLSIIATTSAPNNTSAFEFMRTTLTAGQTTFAAGAFSAVAQLRAAAYSGQGSYVVTTSTVLPSTAGTKLIGNLATGAITTTLPPATGMVGQPIRFLCAGSFAGGWTIVTQGGDFIQGLLGASNIASFVIPWQASITLVSDGTVYYAQAASPNFNTPSLLITNGWRQNGDGSIDQWGQITIPTGNGDAISFPRAFPTACLNIQVTDYGPGCYQFGSSFVTVSGFKGYAKVAGTNTYAGAAYAWRAIGY